MAEMAYQREYRRATIALASQRAKAEAIKDAGFSPAPVAKPAPKTTKPGAKAKAKPPTKGKATKPRGLK